MGVSVGPPSTRAVVSGSDVLGSAECGAGVFGAGASCDGEVLVVGDAALAEPGGGGDGAGAEGQEWADATGADGSGPAVHSVLEVEVVEVAEDGAGVAEVEVVAEAMDLEDGVAVAAEALEGDAGLDAEMGAADEASAGRAASGVGRGGAISPALRVLLEQGWAHLRDRMPRGECEWQLSRCPQLSGWFRLFNGGAAGERAATDQARWLRRGCSASLSVLSRITQVLDDVGMMTCTDGRRRRVSYLAVLRSQPCGVAGPGSAARGAQPDHADAPDLDVDTPDGDKPLSVLVAIQDGTRLWFYPDGCGREDTRVLVELQVGDVLVYLGDVIHAGAGYDALHYRLHLHVDPPADIYDRPYERRDGRRIPLTALCTSAGGGADASASPKGEHRCTPAGSGVRGRDEAAASSATAGARKRARTAPRGAAGASGDATGASGGRACQADVADVAGGGASASGASAGGDAAASSVCPICYAAFDEPFTLSCLHTFCTPCLRGLIRAAHAAATAEVIDLDDMPPLTVRCPQCRLAVPLRTQRQLLRGSAPSPGARGPGGAGGSALGRRSGRGGDAGEEAGGRGKDAGEADKADSSGSAETGGSDGSAAGSDSDGDGGSGRPPATARRRPPVQSEHRDPISIAEVQTRLAALSFSLVGAKRGGDCFPLSVLASIDSIGAAAAMEPTEDTTGLVLRIREVAIDTIVGSSIGGIDGAIFRAGERLPTGTRRAERAMRKWRQCGHWRIRGQRYKTPPFMLGVAIAVERPVIVLERRGDVYLNPVNVYGALAADGSLARVPARGGAPETIQSYGRFDFEDVLTMLDSPHPPALVEFDGVDHHSPFVRPRAPTEVADSADVGSLDEVGEDEVTSDGSEQSDDGRIDTLDDDSDAMRLLRRFMRGEVSAEEAGYEGVFVDPISRGAVEVRAATRLGTGEVGLFATADLAPQTYVCYFGGEFVPSAMAVGRHLYSVQGWPGMMIDGSAARRMPITHAGALVNSSVHSYGKRNVDFVWRRPSSWRSAQHKLLPPLLIIRVGKAMIPAGSELIGSYSNGDFADRPLSRPGRRGTASGEQGGPREAAGSGGSAATGGGSREARAPALAAPGGSALVGTRVRVWDDEVRWWFAGNVAEYHLGDDTYGIDFDDQGRRTLQLTGDQWAVERSERDIYNVAGTVYDQYTTEDHAGATGTFCIDYRRSAVAELARALQLRDGAHVFWAGTGLGRELITLAVCWPRVQFAGVERVAHVAKRAQRVWAALAPRCSDNLTLATGDAEEERNDDGTHTFSPLQRRYTHVYSSGTGGLRFQLRMARLAVGARVCLLDSALLQYRISRFLGNTYRTALLALHGGNNGRRCYAGDITGSAMSVLVEIGITEGEYDTGAESTDEGGEPSARLRGRRTGSRGDAPPEPWEWSEERFNVAQTALGRSLAPGFQEVRAVSRRQADGTFAPWLLVAQSATRDELGLQAWGLYPLRTFARHDCIADWYPGNVVYSSGDITSAEAASAIGVLVRAGGRNLLAVRRGDESGLTDIVDADLRALPPMWALHTTADTGREPTVRFTTRGRCVAVRTAHAPVLLGAERGDVSAYLDLTLEQLRRYELLAAPFRTYWPGLSRAGAATRSRERGGGGSTGPGSGDSSVPPGRSAGADAVVGGGDGGGQVGRSDQGHGGRAARSCADTPTRPGGIGHAPLQLAACVCGSANVLMCQACGGTRCHTCGRNTCTCAQFNQCDHHWATCATCSGGFCARCGYIISCECGYVTEGRAQADYARARRRRVARSVVQAAHMVRRVRQALGVLDMPICMAIARQGGTVTGACFLCGAVGGLFVSMEEGVQLCATAGAEKALSCAWLYSQHAGDAQVRLMEGSPLRCSVTGSRTLLGSSGWRQQQRCSAMGVAPMRDAQAWVVVNAERAPASAARDAALAQWRPLLSPRGAAGCITFEMPLALAAQERQRPRNRDRFRDVYAYRRTWQDLVEITAEAERTAAKAQQQTGVQLRWEQASGGGQVAVFNTTLRLKVEERVELECAASAGGGDGAARAAWSGVGLVKRTRVRARDMEVAVLLTGVPRNVGCEGYTVRSAWNGTTFERMQTALKLADSEPTAAARAIVARLVGTPQCEETRRVRVPQGDLTVPGRPALNTAQSEAVLAGLTQRITMVQGPPGTGKTAVVAAVCYHAARRGQGQVLVCAPSNVATSRVAEALAATGLRTLRLYPRAKEAESLTLPESVRLAHHARNVDDDAARALEGLAKLKNELGLTGADERLVIKLQRKVRAEALLRADVICCTASMAGELSLAQHAFGTVIVDEAATAPEPELIVPLTLGAEQFVIVGDHKQLGPCVTSREAQRAGYGTSMFERLAWGLVQPHLLDVQYRMHPQIAAYPSTAFYQGRIRNGVSAAQRASAVAWPSARAAGYFHDVAGTEARAGHSWVNEAEAEVVVALVCWLRRRDVPASDIAVIATYAAQARLIHNKLTSALSAIGSGEAVAAHTTDAYQGQERPYVIVSYVRTSSLGFIDDNKRINVALTRAQCARVCVGRCATLRSSAALRGLIDEYTMLGAVYTGTPGEWAAEGVALLAAAGSAAEGASSVGARLARQVGQAIQQWVLRYVYDGFMVHKEGRVMQRRERHRPADLRSYGGHLAWRARAVAARVLQQPWRKCCATCASRDSYCAACQGAERSSIPRPGVRERHGASGGALVLSAAVLWESFGFDITAARCAPAAPATVGVTMTVKAGDGGEGSQRCEDAADIFKAAAQAIAACASCEQPGAADARSAAGSSRRLRQRPPGRDEPPVTLVMWAERIKERIVADGSRHNTNGSQKSGYPHQAVANFESACRQLSHEVYGGAGAGQRSSAVGELSLTAPVGGDASVATAHDSACVDAGDDWFGSIGGEAAQWSLFGRRALRRQHWQGLFRRMLCHWRGRVVGWLTAHERARYWRLQYLKQWDEVDELRRRVRYDNGRLPGSPQLPASILAPLRARVRHSASGTLMLRRIGEPRPGRGTPGFWSFHVRLCACGYGAKGALGLMVTERDRAEARELADRVIAWYLEALVPLLALRPHAAVVARFAYPGGSLEALRQLGVSACGVDIVRDMSMARNWFHVLAAPGGRHCGFGVPGPRGPGRATIHTADALDRMQVADALRAHDRRAQVVAHADSPPCTPYGALPMMAGPRELDVEYHQACMGTVVMQRLNDYHRRKEMFLIESVTRAGQFVPEGAVAVCVDGADVGVTDKHVFITPADRPFIRDAVLQDMGARIRAGTCAGPRPTSQLHPDGVPVQSEPWSLPCCAGNSGPEGRSVSAWGRGTAAAPLAVICKWLGVSPDHCTSARHIANVVAVRLSKWGQSQMVAQALSCVSGMPIISYSSGARDSGLAAWRKATHERLRTQGAEAVTLPLRGAWLVIRPATAPGHLLLDRALRVPFICVPADGVDFVESVVEHARARFDALQLLPQNLRFAGECDGALVFVVAQVSDIAMRAGMHVVTREHTLRAPRGFRAVVARGRGRGRGRGDVDAGDAAGAVGEHEVARRKALRHWRADGPPFALVACAVADALHVGVERTVLELAQAQLDEVEGAGQTAAQAAAPEGTPCVAVALPAAALIGNGAQTLELRRSAFWRELEGRVVGLYLPTYEQPGALAIRQQADTAQALEYREQRVAVLGQVGRGREALELGAERGEVAAVVRVGPTRALTRERVDKLGGMAAFARRLVARAEEAEQYLASAGRTPLYVTELSEAGVLLQGVPVPRDEAQGVFRVHLGGTVVAQDARVSGAGADFAPTATTQHVLWRAPAAEQGGCGDEGSGAEEAEAEGGVVLAAFPTAATELERQRQELTYLERRREYLKDTGFVTSNPFDDGFGESAEGGGEEAGPKVARVEVVSLLLRWQRRYIVQALDHRTVGLIEALRHPITGDERRGLAAGAEREWSKLRTLQAALGNVIAGTALEAKVLAQLCWRRTLEAPPLAVVEKRHAAVDHTGKRGGHSAVTRVVARQVFMLDVGEALSFGDGVAAATDAGGSEAALRTPAGAAPAGYADRVVGPADVDLPQSMAAARKQGHLIFCTAEELVGHFASTGRGQMACALSGALGLGEEAAATLLAIEKTGLHHLTDVSGPAPAREDDGVERDGTGYCFLLDAGAFEALRDEGEAAYVVPESAVATAPHDFRVGRGLRFTTAVGALTVEATVRGAQRLTEAERRLLLEQPATAAERLGATPLLVQHSSQSLWRITVRVGARGGSRTGAAPARPRLVDVLERVQRAAARIARWWRWRRSVEDWRARRAAAQRGGVAASRSSSTGGSERDTATDEDSERGDSALSLSDTAEARSAGASGSAGDEATEPYAEGGAADAQGESGTLPRKAAVARISRAMRRANRRGRRQLCARPAPTPPDAVADATGSGGDADAAAAGGGSGGDDGRDDGKGDPKQTQAVHERWATVVSGALRSQAVHERWTTVVSGALRSARRQQAQGIAHESSQRRAHVARSWRRVRRRVAQHAATAAGLQRGPGVVQYKVTPRGLASEGCKEFDVVVLDAACTASRDTHEMQVSGVAPVYKHRAPARRQGELRARAVDFDKPGTVQWHVSTPLARGQRVAAVMARWQVDGPRRHCSVRPPAEWGEEAALEIRRDTVEQRRDWFNRGLREVERQLGDAATVAFAWSSDPQRRADIADFAQRHQGRVTVTVVRDSTDMRADMQRRAAGEASALRKASAQARAAADAMPTARLRALARAVQQDIDLALLASPDGPAQRQQQHQEHQHQRQAHAHTSLELMRQGDVAAAAALLSEAPGEPDGDKENDPVWQMQQAVARVDEYRRELREHNAACDARYREQLCEALREGTVKPREMCESLLGESLAKAVLGDSADEAAVPAGQQGAARDGMRGLRAWTEDEDGQCCWHIQPTESFKIDVSSKIAGRNTPARLRGLEVLSADGSGTEVVASVNQNICDSGSSTYLLGYAEYERLAGISDDAVQVVSPLETSLQEVSGVGGAAGALFHVRMRIMLGGCQLVLHDVPVVAGIPGLLLGTDVLGTAGATLDFWGGPRLAADGLMADGALTLRHPVTHQTSGAVPFTHRRDTRRDVERAIAQRDGSEPPPEDAQERAMLAALEVAKAAAPIAFAPEEQLVKAWSTSTLRVRIPSTLAAEKDVCIIPMEDERIKDLAQMGLVLASTVCRVDAEGYAHVEVRNLTARAQRVPMLAAVGRFMIDPTVEARQCEHSVDDVMKMIHLEDDISDEDRAVVREVVAENLAFFSSTLGYAHAYKMSIRTPLIDEGKAQPPAAPNRPRSREETAALKEAVEKQLKAGLIMPCCSPYNAQPVLIRKADWTPEKPSYRVTLDFRNLNALCDKDSYPLPGVEGHLSALGKADKFTTLDLLMGFHQVELSTKDGSHLKTAFGTPWGQYCYVRMPMGLTSSPAVFMRAVDAALAGLPTGMALAYCDDVIIPTAGGGMRKHADAVHVVFQRLRTAGFTARADKVHIARKEVPYLGFLAGSGGTRPHPAKTAALLAMAVEQLIDEPAAIGRFAGMINVYARWIPRCQVLLAPFHDLKQKGADMTAAESLRARAGFAALVHALANATALARPDFSKPFYVDADSATVGGVGYVITQRADESDPESHKPLAFGSHKFTDMERGFPVRDQECFGVYAALKDWRHMLLGATVIVRTDHKSLQWLMKNTHPDGSRVANWALRLQEYQLTIEWVAGHLHVAADCMSRAFGKDAPSVGGAAPGDADAAAAGGGSGGRARTASATQATAKGDELDELAGALDKYTALARDGSGRHAERVSLVLLAGAEAEDCKILIERVDHDLFTIPSVVVREGGGTYRHQLWAYMAQAYGRSAQMTEVVAKASSHRATQAGGVSVFLAWLREPRDADLRPGSGFVRLQAGLDGLMDGRHGSVVKAIMRMHDIVVNGPSQSEWRGLWEGLRRVEAHRRSAEAFTTDPVWEVQTAVPTYDEAPQGPAFCVSNEHVQKAAGQLTARVREHPDIPLVIDLEGELGGRQSYISLLQACVDAAAGPTAEQQLVYVFDTHVNKGVLRAEGAGTLRALLESGAVVKSLHCCNGDAASMYREYGIKLNHFIDTGLADTLLRRHEPNVQRGLGRVLKHWLGDTVQLTHKGAMEFTPGMFNKRPLTMRDFVYSYEDVMSGGRLHEALVRELRAQDLEQLALGLSQPRSPAYAVPIATPARYPEGTRIAVALVDETAVACLSHRDSRECSLAMALAAEVTPITQVVKQLAQHVWARCMGPAPKGVAAAVNARPRKPVQIGDTLLYVAAVPSCTAALEVLNDALAGATTTTAGYEVVVRSRLCSRSHSVGVRADQRALFQYLYVDADRQQHKRNGNYAEAYAVVSTSEAAQPGLGLARRTLTVQAQVAWAAGRVKLGLFTVRRAARTRVLEEGEEEAYITVGATTTNTRAALVLHDDELVFVLNGETPEHDYSIPSGPVEVGGTPEEAAVKGFDLMAGVALRRGVDNGAQATGGVAPLSTGLGPLLQKGFESELRQLGRFGNTTYFACVLEKGTLRHYASSFYMARQPVTGFRVTPTLAKRHCGFRLCRVGTALERLQKYDKDAMAAALSSSAAATPGLQRMGVALVARALDRVQHDGDEEATAPTASEPDTAPDPRATARPHSTGKGARQRGRCSSPPQQGGRAGAMPQLGEDVDFDALFEAHVAMMLFEVEAADDGRRAQHSDAEAEACGEAAAYAVDAAGTALGIVKREELRAAQWEHDDMAWLAEFLTHGTVATPAPEALTAERAALASAHTLGRDGLLRRRTAKGLRVAVPEDKELRNGIARCWHKQGNLMELFSFDVRDAVHVSQHSEGGAQVFHGEGEAVHVPLTRAELLEAQLAHPGTAALIEHLTHGTVADEEGDSGDAAQQEALRTHELATDGLLVRRVAEGVRIVVPPSLRRRVFKQCHDVPGHFGIKKSFEHVRRLFTWAGVKQMRAELSDYIRTCDACQRSNIHHHAAGRAHMAQHGEGPCLMWAVDKWAAGLASGGCDGLLNFMCLFSHLVVAEPVNEELTAQEVCEIMMNRIINVYGIPEAIRSDAASILTANVVQEFYKVYGITMKASTAYTHRSIGALERFHSVLKKLMMARRIQTGDDDWTKFVGNLVYAYNNTVSATGYTPFFVVFGRDGGLPVDAAMRVAAQTPHEELPEYVKALLKRLHVVWDVQAQALLRNTLLAVKKMNLKYDVNEQFREGDLVLIRKGTAVDNLRTHPKAVEIADGPYRIIECLPRDNFRLGDLKSRRRRDVVDGKRLTRYHRRLLDSEAEARKHPRLERRWAVEALVAHQVRQGELEYKVRWSGLDKCYDKYYQRSQLHEVWELVQAYDARHGIEQGDKASEYESREVPDTPPPVEPRARQRAHFRPVDPERRREAAGSATVDSAKAARSCGHGENDNDTCGTQGADLEQETGADAPAQQSECAEPGLQIKCEERAGAVATEQSTWSDAAAQRRERREAARQAQLDATAARREAAAQARREKRAEIAEQPQAFAAEAPSAPEGDVTLRAEGGSITTSKRAACLSGTLRAMLTGADAVEGAAVDEIALPELQLHLVAVAVRYMEFKLAKQEGGKRVPFDIEGHMAEDLFRVANYLDL